jgi:signal transduction histidine kinase
VLLNTDLRRTRQRLVFAREEERRRTAHALHDGLETVLTDQVARLATIRALAASDPDRAGAELDAAAAGTRGVIKDVRAMVAGLRPPALDQLGLIGAIRERVSRRHDESGGRLPLLAVVAENDLGRLPAAVEVAAFWIVVEAAGHAESAGSATRPRATLSRRGDLFVEVHNGHGFRPGPGLAGAANRAAELGGTMTTMASALQVRLPIRERT